MKYATGSAASVIVFSILLSACERDDRGLAPEVQPLGSAAPVTRVPITDPRGDAVATDGSGVTAEPYQDIVRAEISKQGGLFTFVMHMDGPLPEASTGPGGTILQNWAWNINSDPAFPRGYPFPASDAAPPEFIVHVLWDGRTFTASVIDRRPLLEGRDARVTPAPVQIEGATMTVWLGSGRLGNVEAFTWIARTTNWASPLGTTNPQLLDRAPDAAPAPWAG